MEERHTHHDVRGPIALSRVAAGCHSHSLPEQAVMIINDLSGQGAPHQPLILYVTHVFRCDDIECFLSVSDMSLPVEVYPDAQSSKPRQSITPPGMPALPCQVVCRALPADC